MKQRYSRFRELWAVPKYRTLFKLGGYFLFFLIFFSIASIGNLNNIKNDEEENISYSMMKKALASANVSIKYNISSSSDYFLEGTIINNILIATIEDDIEMKKIKIIDDQVYLIEKNIEVKEDILLNDINITYLFPSNIINVLNNQSSVMKQSGNQKKYTYDIEGISYVVYINDDAVEEIIITDNEILYSLKYSIIE
ncbi:MAG: hypothetical protein PHG03_03970 [Bacilli bacterium]|nr:hypothetical protein [Bacilli bacterium]